MKKYYTIGEAAKILNVHRTTLQRWDREGILKAFRLPSGRRRYSIEQIEQVMGSYSCKNCYIYLRRKDYGNFSDFLKNVESFKSYAKNEKYKISKVFIESNESGLNVELNKMFKEIVIDKPDILYIENKNCFVNEGFVYVKELLENIGIDIKELNLKSNCASQKNETLGNEINNEMEV